MKVSVCMITYNHENYIREAIEGVLMQNTNFNYELIIANDKSVDGTENIILSLIKNHPNGNRIRLFTHSENKGMMSNFTFALQQCKGEYIALCDGDDFWIDPLKIQKQVDFLEANLDYSICWSKYYIKNESDTLSSLQEPDWVLQFDTKNDITIDLNSIFTPYCTYTLTSLFRSTSFDFCMMKNLKYSKDNSLYAICLSKGKGMLMNFYSSVYRMHQGGVYSSASVYTQKHYSYLNLREIVSKIPSCNNSNIRNIRNHLLLESIKLHPKPLSLEYSSLIIDCFKFLGLKKSLVKIIKNITNRNCGK